MKKENPKMIMAMITKNGVSKMTLKNWNGRNTMRGEPENGEKMMGGARNYFCQDQRKILMLRWMMKVDQEM